MLRTMDESGVNSNGELPLMIWNKKFLDWPGKVIKGFLSIIFQPSRASNGQRVLHTKLVANPYQLPNNTEEVRTWYGGKPEEIRSELQL